jgi:PPOX class probable F420-dependent enzyme
MNPLDQFSDQTYLNLETFRRNGAGMKTPVWFVQQGEKLYVRTIADSGKVKRIRNISRINISPCRVDGEPIGNWSAARGREVQSTSTFEESINRLFDLKYDDRYREVTRKSAGSGRKYTVLEIVFD